MKRRVSPALLLVPFLLGGHGGAGAPSGGCSGGGGPDVAVAGSYVLSWSSGTEVRWTPGAFMEELDGTYVDGQVFVEGEPIDIVVPCEDPAFVCPWEVVGEQLEVTGDADEAFIRLVAIGGEVPEGDVYETREQTYFAGSDPGEAIATVAASGGTECSWSAFVEVHARDLDGDGRTENVDGNVEVRVNAACLERADGSPYAEDRYAGIELTLIRGFSGTR